MSVAYIPPLSEVLLMCLSQYVSCSMAASPQKCMPEDVGSLKNVGGLLLVVDLVQVSKFREGKTPPDLNIPTTMF